MAGAFAHMSVADSLCDEPDFLLSAGRIGEIARYAITKNKNFCELGSVSPDLPYLDFLNANSKGWANVMHYWKTADKVLGCFKTGGRVQPKGVRGMRRTSPTVAESSQVFGVPAKRNTSNR